MQYNNRNRERLLSNAKDRLLPHTGHISDAKLKFLFQEILDIIDQMNIRLDEIEEAQEELQSHTFTSDYD